MACTVNSFRSVDQVSVSGFCLELVSRISEHGSWRIFPEAVSQISAPILKIFLTVCLTNLSRVCSCEKLLQLGLSWVQPG